MAVPTNKTASSLTWSFVERFSAQGIQFAFSIVIARQLLPSDYGMIAMLGIFIALAQTLIDSGFSSALIQKQDRTETDFSTVFYFSLGVSLLFYSLIAAGAPGIAAFYGLPRLEAVTRWIGLIFIINSLSTVPRTKLTIELNFKHQAWASFVSVLVGGGVATWMAYAGFGVWTLVTQQLLSGLLSTTLLFALSRWRPRRIFSLQSFKQLFGFGSKLLAGGLLSTLYNNVYTLIIGKFFASTELGYFNRAVTLAQFPSINISNIITRVTYPIECRYQDDNRTLEAKFYVFIRTTAFLVFPLMTLLCALADPLVRLLLTDKWIGAVPYIRLLSIAYMWDPLMRMNWDLLNVKHRSDYSLRSEIIKKSVAFAILLLTLPGGVGAMCAGLIVYSLADLVVITRFTRRLLPGVSFGREMRAITPTLALTALMGTTAYAVTWLSSSPALQLVIGGAAGVLTYAIAATLTRRPEVQLLTSLIKKRT